jgi:indole-3-glycerol phosphate synthase
VLLIARALPPARIAELAGAASELGLARLVEVHGLDELEPALGARPEAVGVNARDLETFEVDVAGVERVLRALPPGVLAVAESGLSERADVERVAGWGADAVLVGTAIARAPDPEAAVRRLTGVRRVGRGSAAGVGRLRAGKRP